MTIDATKKSGVRWVGDVEFETAAPVASYITPVPGGVGPMTVAMLMSNTIVSAKRFLQGVKEPMVYSQLKIVDPVPRLIIYARFPHPVVTLILPWLINPNPFKELQKNWASLLWKWISMESTKPKSVCQSWID